MAILYAFLSALAVSAVSLIGIFVLFSKEQLHGRKVHIFLALAAGAMLGNAVLHLVPHALTLEQQAIESGNPPALVQLFNHGEHGDHAEAGDGHKCEHCEHDEHKGHDHDAHAGHDDHKGHDHDAHAGHDHKVVHIDDLIKKKQEEAHAGHDHDAHAGHDHAGHGHTGLFTCLMILLGIGAFYTFDLYLQNRKQRLKDKETVSSEGYMVVAADMVENLLDGIVIGTAYLLSIPAGIAATITIFLHEIPLEMGDFAVMRHAGISHRKAILANFLSGLVSVVGVGVAVVLGMTLSGFALYATPIAAGGFIYIACTILIPKLRSQCCDGAAWQYFLMSGLGLAVMVAILFFE